MVKKIKTYDVIIVGAGPAGSTCAWYLASKGLDVLVFERKKFPRYKICAGGIPLVVQDFIGDFPFEKKFYNVTLIKNKRKFNMNLKSPLVTVRREKFDHHLLKKAKSAGTEILFEAVTAIHNTQVYTASKEFKARIIVGADGAHSVVRKSLGIEYHRWIDTIEYELPGYADEFIVAVGPGPGYAWLWPKGNVIAFGGGGFGPAHRWADRLAHYLGLVPTDKGYRYRYHLWNKGERIKDNTILIGDAGAFASPITGAGIYTGVLSALEAGKMIYQHIKFNKPLHDPYFRRLYNEFIPAAQLATVLYSAPAPVAVFSKPVIHRFYGSVHGYLKMMRSLYRCT